MPVKIKKNMSINDAIVLDCKKKLATFLTPDELSITEIKIVDGKVFFNSNDEILLKIKANFGEPIE